MLKVSNLNGCKIGQDKVKKKCVRSTVQYVLVEKNEFNLECGGGGI